MKIFTQIFLVIIGLAFAMVGVQALLTPQAVMDNVAITLDNISALSSTRAMYGGVNLLFGLFCLYGAFRASREALILVALYTIGFVIGRSFSIFADGMPNSFVLTWFTVEAVVAVIAVFLLYNSYRKSAG